MHPNILSEAQKELLPVLGSMQREFYLVGGTAIALQIGHRQSIDFDMFKKGLSEKRKSAKHYGIIIFNGKFFSPMPKDSTF